MLGDIARVIGQTRAQEEAQCDAQVWAARLEMAVQSQGDGSNHVSSGAIPAQNDGFITNRPNVGTALLLFEIDAHLFRNILLNIEKKIEQVSIQPQIEVPVGEKPHFLVPFPKDVDFISRPEIQSWIREQYAGTRSRLALIGIGGIG